MSTVDLDSAALEELNSSETRKIFDAVDKLSTLRVGRIVNLPQIIVVGDQSSGKSSVLEAISGVHFPAADGVCTRFATELVLRPGSSLSVKATVHFADDTKPEEPLQAANFKQDDMGHIIREAKEKMKISSDNRSFSKDVLRLEIERPNMYPLTLIDLPGIFHAETAEQSIEGMTTVMELLDSYMKNPNSIFLAIVSAQTGLANQAVMQQALKHDPQRTRTLGILTKPDLLQSGSPAERERYLQIVRGHEPTHRLGLGWHVLRNLPDYQQDLGPRDEVEARFLELEPWVTLPQSSRGSSALRVRLASVLHEHIKKELPSVLENIQTALSEKQAEQSQLGNTRSTTEEMKAYLIDIAVKFERLIRADIRGQYTDPLHNALTKKQQHLRSQLRNLNRCLRHVLLVLGATRIVEDRPESLPNTELLPSGYLGDFLQEHGYADGLDHPERISAANLSALLERQTAVSQGMEFPGNANTHVMVDFFQSQIQPWQPIAERHLERVMNASKTFVQAIFEHVVGPFSSNRTTRAILSTYVDDFFDEKEKVLAAKLEELLRPYREGYALPLDHDFHEEMAKRAAERIASQRDNAAATAPEQQESRTVPSKQHSEFGTEDIIDNVQVFYDMALRTFTENVINLAVEGCLIQDLPGIFTPQLVNSMDEAMVTELAAESEEVRHSRSRLEKDIRLLEDGLRECRPFRTRAALNVSSSGNVFPRRAAQPHQGLVGSEQATSTQPADSSRIVNETPHAPQAFNVFSATASAAPLAIRSKPVITNSATSSSSSGPSLFGNPNPTKSSSHAAFSFASPPTTNQPTQYTGLFSDLAAAPPFKPSASSTSLANSSGQSKGLFSGLSVPSPKPSNGSKSLFGSPGRSSDGAVSHGRASPTPPNNKSTSLFAI